MKPLFEQGYTVKSRSLAAACLRWLQANNKIVSGWHWFKTIDPELTIFWFEYEDDDEISSRQAYDLFTKKWFDNENVNNCFFNLGKIAKDSECKVWCEENLDPENWRIIEVDESTIRVYVFDCNEDALAFKLAWVS